jgi:hypothetical protein
MENNIAFTASLAEQAQADLNVIEHSPYCPVSRHRENPLWGKLDLGNPVCDCEALEHAYVAVCAALRETKASLRVCLDTKMPAVNLVPLPEPSGTTRRVVKGIVTKRGPAIPLDGDHDSHLFETEKPKRGPTRHISRYDENLAIAMLSVPLTSGEEYKPLFGDEERDAEVDESPASNVMGALTPEDMLDFSGTEVFADDPRSGEEGAEDNRLSAELLGHDSLVYPHADEEEDIPLQFGKDNVATVRRCIIQISRTPRQDPAIRAFAESIIECENWPMHEDASNVLPYKIRQTLELMARSLVYDTVLNGITMPETVKAIRLLCGAEEHPHLHAQRMAALHQDVDSLRVDVS